MKNIKSTIVFLGIAGALFIIITFIASSRASNAPREENVVSDTPQVNTNTMYTLAQVAAHKDATSCWTIVRTNVYDLSAWIAAHPGGDKAILGLCGKDGTKAFEGQHGGQENPEKALEGFQIGIYKSN